MAGSWEGQRPNVLVATLATETVPTKWAVAYKNLILPPNSGTSVIMGMTFDHGRNQGAHNCLAGGFEWLFWLDSDVCPPPDVIPRLMALQNTGRLSLKGMISHEFAFTDINKALDLMRAGEVLRCVLKI